MPKADRQIPRRQSAAFMYLKEVAKRHSLNSVCESLECQNYTECWNLRTAKFLLPGKECTRDCKFCPVPRKRKPKRPDFREPWRLANAVSELALKYVVLSSVARDDLRDGGAAHLARCITEIKRRNPGTVVEVLIPDFKGDRNAIRKVMDAGPDVIGHSLGIIRRLTPHVKDRNSKYEQSLEVLKTIKRIHPRAVTKSSITLGFRESWVEVISTMRHLRKAGVDILTIGQYLRPSKQQLPVREYIDPERFEFYEREAYRMGFKFVKSGPFVQSSYRAAEAFMRK